MFDFQVEKSQSEISARNPAVIKVVGCGGGGGNAVNMMIDANVQGVEFIAVNTDGQDLDKSKAANKVQIGKKNAGGLGAGGDPSLGEEAAKESENEIKDLLSNANMVFITAGMGGGTGTGSAPVVAKIAHDLGALTVAVVTYPFEFEGKVRANNADLGIKKLRGEVDSLIIVPNEKIFEIRDDIPVTVAFPAVTDILRQGVQGITDIIKRPGFINRDFRDVQSVMRGQGQALLGIGVGNGENRALDAATDAINNPLLEDTHIDGARNILVNICGGNSIGMKECKEIVSFITSRAAKDANVIWGLVIDENPKDEISVTVIATGFESQDGASDEIDKTQSLHNSDILSDGEFKRITTQRPVPQPTPEPAPAAARQGRGEVQGILGGAAIYEDDEKPRPASAQQPQQPVRSSGVRIPDDYVDDQNDLTKPTIARKKSKLSGLQRGINLGGAN